MTLYQIIQYKEFLELRLEILKAIEDLSRYGYHIVQSAINEEYIYESSRGRMHLTFLPNEQLTAIEYEFIVNGQHIRNDIITSKYKFDYEEGWQHELAIPSRECPCGQFSGDPYFLSSETFAIWKLRPLVPR